MYKLIVLLLLNVFCFLSVPVFADSRKVINVAGIFTPFNASGGTDVENIQSISAFIMGIQEINSRNDILPNHIVKFTVRSPIGFIDTVETIIDIQKHAFNGTNVEAFVTGLPYSTTSALNNVINEHLQKLYITTTTGAVQLSHSDVGSYKIRTVPADSFNGMALQDVIDNAFKYNKVSLFYSYDEASLRTSMEIGDGVFGKMEQLSSHAFQTRTADFTDHINAAKDAGSQIFIISCDGQDGAVLMEQGYNQGLFREGTQIFGSALLTQSHPWKYMSNHANIPDIMKGYIGIMFDPSFHLQDSQEGKDFVSKFRSQKATVTVNSDGTETCDESKDDDDHYLYREQTQTHSGPVQRVRCAGMDFSSLKVDGSDIAPYAPHAYDAVYLLAYGLHNLLEIQGYTQIDGDKLRQTIIENVTFYGTTGFVDIYEGMFEFDNYGSGDRESGHGYRLYNFNEEVYRQTSGMNGYVDIGHWTPEKSFHLCVDTDISSSSGNGNGNGTSSLSTVVVCNPVTYRTIDNQRARDSPDDIILVMPDAMRMALYVIGSLIAILVIAVTMCVWKYKQSRIIKVSQPAMLYVILAGAMIGAGRVIAGGIPLSDITCIADIWLIHLSFVLLCGSLFVKSWRVNALLNSSKIRRVKITINNVLSKVALATAIMILYLIFISIFGDTRKVFTSTLAHNQVTIRSHCTYKYVEMEMALYAIEGVVLALGARLCWALKTLPSSFNESKHIASSITCLVSITALVIPLVYLLNLEPHIGRFIIAMAYGVWITFTVIVMFGEKIYIAVTGKDSDDDNYSNTNNNNNNNRSNKPPSSSANNNNRLIEVEVEASVDVLNENTVRRRRRSSSLSFLHSLHSSISSVQSVRDSMLSNIRGSLSFSLSTATTASTTATAGIGTSIGTGNTSVGVGQGLAVAEGKNNISNTSNKNNHYTTTTTSTATTTATGLDGSGSGKYVRTILSNQIQSPNLNTNINTNQVSHTRGGGGIIGRGGGGGGGGGVPLLRARSSLRNLHRQQSSLKALKGISEIESSNDELSISLPRQNQNQNLDHNAINGNTKNNFIESIDKNRRTSILSPTSTSTSMINQSPFDLQKSVVEELFEQNSNKKIFCKENNTSDSPSTNQPISTIAKGFLNTFDKSTLLRMDDDARKLFIRKQMLLWQESLINIINNENDNDSDNNDNDGKEKII